MVAPVAAAVGGAAAGGVKAASMGSVAPTKMINSFGGSGMKFGLNSLGSTDITSVLLNIEKEEKQRNQFASMSLLKLTSIGGMLHMLETGTPFKAVVKLLTSILQVFLIPVGMILLTLFKPVLIAVLKMSMDFIKWMNSAPGARIMLFFEGIGETLTASLLQLKAVGTFIITLISVTHEVFNMFSNVLIGFFSGGIEGAKFAAAEGTIKISEIISTGLNQTNELIENAQLFMASGITKVGVALSGSDGLVEMLKNKAPQEALIAFGTYIGNQVNAEKEGSLAKALGGLALVAVSANSIMLDAYKNEAKKIADANLVGLLTDAIMGKSQEFTSSNVLTTTWEGPHGERVSSVSSPGFGWRAI